MKFNPSDQKIKNEEQVIHHKKDNTNTNKINGQSEISVIANCINTNFENIDNSAMKDSDNMKKIINKNVDIESNKQIRKKVIRNVSENCKNILLEKISESDKTNFKCNFENDVKFLRKKTCIKLLWGK